MKISIYIYIYTKQAITMVLSVCGGSCKTRTEEIYVLKIASNKYYLNNPDLSTHKNFHTNGGNSKSLKLLNSLAFKTPIPTP